MKEKGEGLGISGFTLGIMSILLAGWLGLIISIIGLIFCIIQQKKNPTSLGKAGIFLNGAGLIFSLVFISIIISSPAIATGI